MKKAISLIAILLLLSTAAFAWVGDSISLVAENPTKTMESTVFGSQSLSVVWQPCGTSRCKTYVPVDKLAVMPTGEVKPNTAYTLVVNTKAAMPKQAICIASKTSTSLSVKVNGTWVKKGYLSLLTNYAWSNLINNGNDETFRIVESAKVNCATQRITATTMADVLSTAAI